MDNAQEVINKDMNEYKKENKKEDGKVSFRQTLRTNILGVIIFELLYHIGMPFLFYEMILSGMHYILKIIGYTYLTSDNVFVVIKNPLTIVFILLVIFLIILAVTYEFSVLMITFRGAYDGQKISFFLMLYYGFRNMIKFIKRKKGLVFIIIAISYLVINLFPIIKMISYVKLIKTAINLIQRTVPIVQTSIVVGIILGILAIIFMFTPMYVSFEKCKASFSMKESIRLYRKTFFTTTLKFVALNGLIVGLYFAFFILLNVIQIHEVRTYADPRMALALTLMISDHINLILLYIVGMATTVLNIALGVHLFYSKADTTRQVIPMYKNKPLIKKKKKIVIGFITAVILVTGLNTYYCIDNGFTIHDKIAGGTLISAHRGASVHAPENTLPAIDDAIKSLADYVEIDVRETKDGVMVLLHDSNLKRTTGCDEQIWNLDYEEVLELDAGGWLDSKFKDTTVPTFSDALDMCKNKIRMNIEIKTSGASPTLSADIYNLVKEKGMINQVVFTSTSINALKTIKELDSDARTGYIVYADYINNYNDRYVDFYSMRSAFLTQSKVRYIHSQGKEVHAWTVDSTSELLRMQRLEVDNVITNEPVLAREVFYGEVAPDTLSEYMSIIFEDD